MSDHQELNFIKNKDGKKCQSKTSKRVPLQSFTTIPTFHLIDPLQKIGQVFK